MTAPPDRPLVDVRRLSVERGSHLAVDDVDLTLDAHEILALVGPSGCGKTTLLRAIAGFERPRSGTVAVGGRVVAGDGTWVPPERRGVGLVFQDGALFPHLTVRENVAFGIRGRSGVTDRVDALLALTHIGSLGERFPDQLSGGQAQRVALARALAPAPPVILFDEPFSGLDAHLRGELRDSVRDVLRRTGTAALFVTHDQGEALELADRIAVMLGGRIVQDAEAERVYDRPSDPSVARFVGDGQLLDGEADGHRVRCALGSVSSHARSGAVHVLIRPEDIRIAEDGVRATVCTRRFLGHDVLHEIELDGGQRVAMRLLHGDGVAVGDRVRVALRDREYAAFAADETP